MICAHFLRHRNIVKNGRPRNLLSREHPRLPGHRRLVNLLELGKERNRKAVFRSIRWPVQSFVTIPCKGSSVTLSPSQVLYKPGGRAIPIDPKSATCPEYQSLPPDAIGILGLFSPWDV